MGLEGLTQELSEKMKGLQEKILESFKAEDYISAIGSLNEIISIRKCGQDYEYLASCYYQLEKNEAALKIYSQAVEIDPLLDQSWKAIGHILSKKGLVNEAIYPYKRALALKPEENAHILNLTTALMYTEKYTESIPYLKKSLELDPKNEKTWHNLGEALKSTGDEIGAIDAYKKSIDLNLKRDVSWISLILLLLQNNMNDSASEYIKQAEKYIEQKDMLRLLESEILMKQNKWDEAVRLTANIENTVIKKAALATIHTATKKTMSGLEYSLEALQANYSDIYIVHKNAIMKAMRQNIVTNISGHVKEYGVKDLIETLRENFDKGLSEHSGYILCALLDATAKDDEYRTLTKELFSRALKDYPQELISLGYNSRNAVNIISKNIISKNLYIIKAVGQDNPSGNAIIDKEFRVARFVKNITDKTVDAIFFEGGYLVEKRITSPSLKEVEEYAEYDELKRYLLDCLDTLAIIHKGANPIKDNNNIWVINYKDLYGQGHNKVSLQKYDFLGELNRRLFDRFPGNTTGLINEYQKLFEGIRLDETFIHSDAYKENWLKEGYIIDWERACIGDPILDVVQLISDPEFADFDKTELLNYYLNKSKFDRDVEKKYNTLSIHNALCQIGSKINQRDIEAANQYLHQVLNLSEGKMKDEIVRYFKGGAK